MSEINICLFKVKKDKVYDFVIKIDGKSSNLPYSITLKRPNGRSHFIDYYKTIEKCFDMISSFIRYKDPLQTVWYTDGRVFKQIAKTKDGAVTYL